MSLMSDFFCCSTISSQSIDPWSLLTGTYSRNPSYEYTLFCINNSKASIIFWMVLFHWRVSVKFGELPHLSSALNACRCGTISRAMALFVFRTSSIGKSCLWLQASLVSIFVLLLIASLFSSFGRKITKEVCQIQAHLQRKYLLILLSLFAEYFHS